VGTETILFVSFISAYLVLRMGAPSWPPIGTPALKIGLSAINTLVIVLSSLSIWRARQPKNVAITLGLGTLFLVLQGVEFHQLYARGLTLQTGPYGAVFFSLVTCHGLHVVGGLAFLAVVFMQALSGKTARAAQVRERIRLSEMYWHFVTAVWLVLFTILYIL
jgi:cytochrome c oxidase subunit 3